MQYTPHISYWQESCGDPACPVCRPPDNFAVGSWPNDRPVKLSPQQPVTHGWDGLDDEINVPFFKVGDSMVWVGDIGDAK